jgi:hypothetical protein
MKNEAEIEMREEYDFSGGVRGRHAARFTASEREDLCRRAAVEDLQTWTMLALYEVQALEAAFFALLVLADNRSPAEALGAAAALVSGGETRISGDVLSSTRRLGLDDLNGRLTFVAAERAWLVHRGGYASHAALSDPEKAPAVVDRLQRLGTEARGLKARVESLVAKHLSEAGLSDQEAITRRNDTVDLWQSTA